MMCCMFFSHSSEARNQGEKKVCKLANYDVLFVFFFSSRRRHTRCGRDWSSDVCSSDLGDACCGQFRVFVGRLQGNRRQDRKSTRLNSSHVRISYAVFCLKKNNTYN